MFYNDMQHKCCDPKNKAKTALKLVLLEIGEMGHVFFNNSNMIKFGFGALL